MPNLKNYAASLGLTTASGTCVILIQNEGRMVLAFYDFTTLQSCGLIRLGDDPTNPIQALPTLTAPNPTMTVLWTGLAIQTKWSGAQSGDFAFMGNGVDDNLVFQISTMTIATEADQVRPLAPTISFVDAEQQAPADAFLQAQGVYFQALEPFFVTYQDYNTPGAPYVRARGNFVQVSVVQSNLAYFESSQSGYGTASNPFLYTVFCPNPMPTEQELVNFIIRDPHAQGLITATLTATTTVAPVLFPATYLTGGVTQFNPTDVFAGPFAGVLLTYFKKGAAEGTGAETMPGPVVSTQLFDNGRIAVTVIPDTLSPIGSSYDTVRIYVADMAAKTFGFSPESYGAFFFALEVPNAAGTYVIAPSMLSTTKVVSIESRPPPPCSMFVFADNTLLMSGNADRPMRVYNTMFSTKENLVPQGVGIYDYQDYQAGNTDDAIAALGSYRGQAVVYTKYKAYPYTTGTITRFALAIGAMNSQTVITWTNGAQYYLGRDLTIYTLTQPVTDARSDVPDFNLPFPQITNYLKQYCDPTDTVYPNGVVDSLNKEWWLWLRGTVGNMQAFVINLEQNQVTGPIDFPQFMASLFLDAGDTRVIGMDMAGNLLWMDFAQPFTLSETFNNNSALTLYPATTPVDNTLDGFGICQVYSTPQNEYVQKAQAIRFQTPWMNLNGADSKKGLYSIQFQCVEGSAGIVNITAFNDKGQSVTRTYGDVFNYTNPHKILLGISGSLVQFLMTVIVADDLPFALRSVTFTFEELGEY